MSLAVTQVGQVSVAVESESIVGFVPVEFATPELDLSVLLGTPAPPSANTRVIRLLHTNGTVDLAVHGAIHLTEQATGGVHQPTIVAGIFRQACLRGVIRLESGLIYLLDPEALAARVADKSGEGGASCASD